MKLLGLLIFFHILLQAGKYLMAGHKKPASKMSGKGHSVVFDEQNRSVNAVIAVCHTKNVDTDV